MTTEVDDGFEVIPQTEVDATDDVEASALPTAKRVRKLCACGCGEEVTGNRALKRGHTIGTGISAKWAPEDLLVIQTAVCSFLLAFTAFVENRWDVPRMEYEEANAIGAPVGRIVARHVKWRYLAPGDMADAVALITAISAYTMRIFMKKESDGRNGQYTNSTVQQSGTLSQYEYKPPEQQAA